MNQPKHNNDNNSSVSDNSFFYICCSKQRIKSYLLCECARDYNAQTKASLSKITSNSGGNDDEILCLHGAVSENSVEDKDNKDDKTNPRLIESFHNFHPFQQNHDF
ncbi:12340_t:CDS:2 [Entrophospora sp. SA101]|nr:313_t:CDS:2 [Entrophospora sp. SA101]CAJ0888478.1 12340_t:CDS:2 [Entrophospora sp. SA101]